MRSSSVPDGVPVLSRGKHRSARRGACFMEFASYLAGERWSDHPACTHPLLAQLARQVNDSLDDEGRQRLVPLVPLVVGATGDEDTWLRLPVSVAAMAILDVPEETQRVLAAGLVSAERISAEAGAELDATRVAAQDALDLVPGAVAWVEQLRIRPRISSRAFADHCASTMVRRTVSGVVENGAPDRDQRLRRLLEAGLAACGGEVVDRQATGSSEASVSPQASFQPLMSLAARSPGPV
jgi:hypothetical protein